jgi:hypothetical protein
MTKGRADGTAAQPAKRDLSGFNLRSGAAGVSRGTPGKSSTTLGWPHGGSRRGGCCHPELQQRQPIMTVGSPRVIAPA